jgi:hypothetical protein
MQDQGLGEEEAAPEAAGLERTEAQAAAAAGTLAQLLDKKKTAAARAMHSGPGCGHSNLASWPRTGALKGCKPLHSHLHAEVLRRSPGFQCSSWPVQKLAEWLSSHAPLYGDVSAARPAPTPIQKQSLLLH